MQQKQRELFAKSMMDLGNLVAVALVFGQFVTGQPFSMMAFGIGLIVVAREYKQPSAITTRFRAHNQDLAHFW
jgi:hypothetical protein